MSAPAFAVLPGGFIFLTWGSHLLTAANGGGQLVDALQTSLTYAPGTPIGNYETFRLWHNSGTPQPSPDAQFALQTSSNNFVTAVDGGGRISDVFHTDATQISGWETFGIQATGASVFFNYFLHTLSANLVTAVGGGGRTTDALHTDATSLGDWELLAIRKVGPLGSGLKYHFTPIDTAFPLLITNGGGQVHNAIQTQYIWPQINFLWTEFTLHGQADGSYTLQTPNGRYLTAVNGGGLKWTSSSPDTLHTDATAPGAWEKFKILDCGDATYAIETTNGHLLHVDGSGISTNATDLAHASRFQLHLAGM